MKSHWQQASDAEFAFPGRYRLEAYATTGRRFKTLVLVADANTSI
jgi:hypothetical protein